MKDISDGDLQALVEMHVESGATLGIVMKAIREELDWCDMLIVREKAQRGLALASKVNPACQAMLERWKKHQ